MLFLGICKPPSLNSQYFFDTLSDWLDVCSNHYHNKVILGDINLKPTDPLMMTFLNEHDLINLIKIVLVLKEKVHVLTRSLLIESFRLKTLLLLK